MTRRPSGLQSGLAFQVVSSFRISVPVALDRAAIRQIPPEPQMCPRLETRMSSRPSGDQDGEKYWSYRP